MIALMNRMQDLMDSLQKLNYVAPLLLRLYLAPVFWVAANNKWNPFDSSSSLDSTVSWFANTLELPFPTLMASLAWATEYFGAILLLIGFGTRWVSIPLMATMLVAAVTVHWQNGWQAVASSSSTFASETLGPFQFEDVSAANEKLRAARSLLEEHGHYDWLTEAGNFVISNNGIEWSVTYFIMLLGLFALGGGKFVSVDYLVSKRFRDVR